MIGKGYLSSFVSSIVIAARHDGTSVVVQSLELIPTNPLSSSSASSLAEQRHHNSIIVFVINHARRLCCFPGQRALLIVALHWRSTLNTLGERTPQQL